jgi:hypothetical protein
MIQFLFIQWQSSQKVSIHDLRELNQRKFSGNERISLHTERALWGSKTINNETFTPRYTIGNCQNILVKENILDTSKKKKTLCRKE